MNGGSFLAAALERLLVGCDSPYTFDEVLEGVREKEFQQVTDQDVHVALESLIKEEKIKCQIFETVPLTLYFDPNSVVEVTVDIKQPVELPKAVTPTSSSRGGIRRFPMRPGSMSHRLRMPFQSPARKEGVVGGVHKLFRNVQGDVDQLRKKNEELDAEILCLSTEYSEDELKEHIDMLHKYNEIKDTGQMLLGKLAELKGTTTKSMYDEFSLSFND